MTTMISDQITLAETDAETATLMKLDAFIDAGLASARSERIAPIVVAPVVVAPRWTPAPEPTPEAFAINETAPVGAVAVAVSFEPDPRATRKIDALLRMADSYRKSGALHQAMEMYYELVSNYNGAPQGNDAEDRLLDIARGYERTGELHQARAIYEQLL
jgi:tetratricopeptide (TPR) repeat protein